MCARFTAGMEREALAALFGLRDVPESFGPRQNVTPTELFPVVGLSAKGERGAAMLRWGLVPAWAKPGDAAARGVVNARAETAAEKPAFREAWRKRRCLVPADGFLEWESVAGGKQPHWFRPADGAPFAFAGLWEPGSPATFAVLTVPAGPDVAWLHERMPAMLAPDQFAAWLDPRTRDPLGLLAPRPAGSLASWPVSRRINAPGREEAGLLERAAGGLFG